MKDKQKFTMNDLLQIMHRLRNECPWDARQTHESLRQFLLEETYEVLETIDQKQWQKMPGELGDLLLQIVFHSEIAAEDKRFDFSDVVDHICKKLIARHPHVFGEKQLQDARQVQDNWEHTKVRDEGRTSLLSGVPAAAPALLQAQRLQEKAATVGFDWPEIEPVFDKVIEELYELKQAVKEGNQQEKENELGDLLFALVNLGRFLNITAEDALRKTNRKFLRRFQHIERQYKGDVKAMQQATLDELDKHWEQAKKNEKK
ncbi:nucleoside triphosphate pyrophosphohydrolase [Caldithrix abyssi]